MKLESGQIVELTGGQKVKVETIIDENTIYATWTESGVEKRAFISSAEIKAPTLLNEKKVEKKDKGS